MIRNRGKNKDNWFHRIHTETKVDMGQTYCKNAGQFGGLNAAQSGNQREGRDRKEGGDHLEHENNRQRTMEGIDRGLHSAVDEQSLGERWNVSQYVHQI